MQPQLAIWKRFIRSLSGLDRCNLIWGSGRGLLVIYQQWTDEASSGDFDEVYQKFVRGGQMQPLLGMWKRFIIRCGQMQPKLGIWKRFIRSLLGVDRCSLSWGFGRGLLEVYQWWTDAASAGDFEEVYQKFASGGQMQPQLGIWKSFIRSLLVVDIPSLICVCGRGFLEVYQWWKDED